MHLRDLYYLLKPAIPRRIRAAARRVLARRLRRRVGHCWPIDEASGRAPEDWPGWPGGKKFAFVLTHDVEGARGLDRCRQLAEMEIGLGFRSSFNFVPEGEYATPPSLRAFLNEAGFEVGVHDLHHDGKLYRSRKAFERHAERINHYLKAWGAVGFRSAFMLHNLDWLQESPRPLRRVDVRHRSVRAAARRHARPSFRSGCPRRHGTAGATRLRRAAVHAAAGLDAVPRAGRIDDRHLEEQAGLDCVARRHGPRERAPRLRELRSAEAATRNIAARDSTSSS